MAGAKIALSSTSGELKTDGNDNARVNLPTTGTQAGFTRLNYLLSSGISRSAHITNYGELDIAQSEVLFSANFNGAAAGALINTQFNQQATTLATGYNAGSLRFNTAAVTTLNTGVSIVSWNTFQIEARSELSIAALIKHTNGAVSNKQFDFGFGYYDVAANQAAANNEFIGFRWSQAGALLGVVEYSTGGAPTTNTVNINGGVPYSDAVVREYEIKVTQDYAEFWVDEVFIDRIARQADAAGIVKASGYPIIARLFHTSAPAAAPVFDINNISVVRHGYQANVPYNVRQVGMGRHSSQGQADLTTTTGNTALIQASGTSPTGTTGSNVATTITGLGGYYFLNGAAVTATNHSNIIISSYLNPLLPEAAGTATDGRTLYITDIMISPQVVTTVLAGGGASWCWWIAVGGTAVSMATGDAIGGASIGTASFRVIPLPMMDTVAAAAAAGTVLTRAGDSSIHLQTPLACPPGRYVQVGIRQHYTAAAITSGVIGGQIGLSGFWE